MPSESDPDAIAVKHEDSEPPPQPQATFELHVYSVEELQKFNKKGLLADTTLLEGMDRNILS